ncbi:hypothetical protein [Halogranum gelatinilyticum]|uniref:hypothetical protein n=1 Tax=Halogranum gelatinilyticum TaxID=660521 RepID=UPI0011141455|nr:hypothetical protein [Halogranum gelatinilyticum]
MKRRSEIQDCENLLATELPDHLHVRRKVIVTGFVEDFKSDLEDYNIVSVDISEWEHAELMETLRYELQKELSTIRYYYSRIKSIGASIPGIGGGSAGVEAKPDYSRTTDYLQDVADKSDDNVVVVINYHGKRPVSGFSWIPKLDIPENATIVTDGYTSCELDITEEYEIGRLTVNQTVDYLTELRSGIDQREAAQIHHVHDGNPVAIEIANQEGSLEQPLEGDALRTLWSEVYDDKISGDELDLLTDSSHLIDLDQRDVASVTDKTRGEAKDILRRLERKGVVSQKQSGLFTTDKYVKRYTASQLTGRELSQQHKMSFHDYAEKWVDSHESRMAEMEEKSKLNRDDPISPPDFDTGLTDPNLFLAIHHLSEIHDELNKKLFVEELEKIDGEKSSVFAFGMIAQRFFFENPTEVLQELSESILNIEGDLENELFSGTLGIFFDFDVQEYFSELAGGWSGSVSTDRINTENVSQPDDVVMKIQQDFLPNIFENLPSDVKTAVSHLIALAVTDTRTAREYYNRFGKTAEKYGLEEEAFCQWLDELGNLADELNPDIDDSDQSDADPYQESFESLNSEIRHRIDLQDHLEQNESQAQEQFQQRIEKIRSRPDEIADQYIRCGEYLEEMDNSIFAFLWYVVGHEGFAKIVLGGKNWKIFGKYNRLSGTREEQEKRIDDEKIVLTSDEIEAKFGGVS